MVPPLHRSSLPRHQHAEWVHTQFSGQQYAEDRKTAVPNNIIQPMRQASLIPTEHPVCRVYLPEGQTLQLSCLWRGYCGPARSDSRCVTQSTNGELMLPKRCALRQCGWHPRPPRSPAFGGPAPVRGSLRPGERGWWRRYSRRRKAFIPDPEIELGLLVSKGGAELQEDAFLHSGICALSTPYSLLHRLPPAVFSGCGLYRQLTQV